MPSCVTIIVMVADAGGAIVVAAMNSMTIHLPAHLTDDEIARAVGSSASVAWVDRGGDIPLPTAVVVDSDEGGADLARRLSRALGCRVGANLLFVGPGSWFLVDPVTGEWEVDHEPGEPEFELKRAFDPARVVPMPPR